MPDVRTLQLFVAVAREGNVSRVAEQARLSQPAVSLQLKRLSRETGTRLFDRTPRGLELTRDGAVLARKAEQVLAAANDFVGTARRLVSRPGGTLRIGTIIDPEFIRLGAFLKAVVETGPDVQPELYHGMSGDVLGRVRVGSIDAGFYLGDVEEETSSGRSEANAPALYHAMALTPLRYMVIAPSAWAPLVKGQDWSGLAKLPWIGTPPLSVHNRLLSRIFAEAGVEQNVVALVDQEASMLEMARTGLGLCLCRDQIALREKQARGLAIADDVIAETMLGFVCLAARSTDPLIELAFNAAARAWA